jgi:DNA-binding IclR family transcriptional regulator
LDRREIEVDVECVSAPIRDYQGAAVAAVSISGPQRKIGTPQEKRFVAAVVEAATQISGKLGFQLNAEEQAGKKSREPQKS